MFYTVCHTECLTNPDTESITPENYTVLVGKAYYMLISLLCQVYDEILPNIDKLR